MSEFDNDERLARGLLFGGHIFMFLGYAWVFALNATGNFTSNWMFFAVVMIFLSASLALGSGAFRLLTCGLFVAYWVICYWLIEFVKHASTA